MKKITILMAILLLVVACGSETAVPAAETGATNGTEQTENNNNNEGRGGQLEFSGELSEAGELALGVLQLEGELALSETQAEAMLPLWEALQTLSADDTTADLELQAVASQIEQSLTEAQQAALADMNLSIDGVNELAQTGGLALGRGGGAPAGADGEERNGQGGGGQGGGFGGAGLGGQGRGQGGGGAPGGGGQLTEEQIAERQARFSNGDAVNDILVGAVIRELNQTLGVVAPRQVINQTITAVMLEQTGLTEEELRAKYGEGMTQAEVIAEAGLDAAAVQAELIAALESADLGEEFDPETIVNDLFAPEE